MHSIIAVLLTWTTELLSQFSCKKTTEFNGSDFIIIKVRGPNVKELPNISHHSYFVLSNSISNCDSHSSEHFEKSQILKKIQLSDICGSKGGSTP